MPNRIIYESARFSETLASISDLAERLFWRLTTVADDFGRFSASAVAVRATCFPLMINKLTDAKVAAALKELATAGVVNIYRAEGKDVGEFRTWKNYQQTRAKKSKFPAPPASDSNCLQMPAVVAEKNQPCSDSTTTTTTTSNKQEGETEGEPSSNGNGHTPEAVRPEDLLEAWNEHCVPLGLAAVRELTPSRRKQVLLRLHEHPETEFWEIVFGNIRGSPLLKGLRPPKKEGERPWRADFDWMIKNDTNAVKIREGKYSG